MTEVVNLHYQDCDVPIHRGTPWGNPYKDGTRAENIEDYRRFLWLAIKNGEIKVADLAELDGKRLGCWCSPRPCHGQVLAKAAKWAKGQLALTL